jgi:hypothetical protein
LADWLRKCCGRTRLETATDAGLAAAHTRHTGAQLLAGSHNPSLVDDSETPVVKPGGTITFLQEFESCVTARAFAAAMEIPPRAPVLPADSSS